MPRIPLDAFDHYVGLGPSRSYAAVARRYGVSKGAITRRAKRDDWQTRLVRIETEARDRAEEQSIESLKSVHARHLRTLRAIQGRALQAIASLPMTTAGEAARTMLAAMAQERGIYDVPGGPEPTIIQVVTGVPERASIEEPKALPAPPRNGHGTRNPSAN